ncbi:PQQ-binding-like beta-propeller repeat protein [Nocardioides sp. NPDC058538]|uniref:outer membrane protein assembly factor BamB family protein n=1 Tax=Nocardioides sp. NPDC058538 TaxID=3346542 RepID=UPI00364DC30C
MRVQRASVMVVVLAGAMLVSCGEGSGSALTEKWSRPGGPQSEFLSSGSWTATDELWIYANIDDSRIEAVRLADGKEAWHLPLEENVCEISPVNEEDLVAVRDHSSGSHGCNRVTVVDTSDGEALWSATFGSIGGRSEGGGMVGLTEATVSVTTDCAIERWEAVSGDRLAPLKARDGAAELGSFGCRVAATGHTALIPERDGLSGLDIDTGQRVWSVAGDSPQVGRVYATDPIVADVWIEGAQGVRTIDSRTGQMGKIVGRSLDAAAAAATPTLGLADVVGDRIVGAYGEELSGSDAAANGAARAWDLVSGTEAWRRASEAGDTFLGADEKGLYIGRDTGSEAAGYRVIRRDLDDGSDEVLGTVGTGPTVVTRVGDLLLVGSADATSGDVETTAYQLPSQGS